jgi:hypothetical protein
MQETHELFSDTEMRVKNNGEQRVPYIKISDFVDPTKQPYMACVILSLQLLSI